MPSRDPDAPFRIAILLPSLKFGGAERVALSLATALNARGHAVTILLMSGEGEFLAEAEAAFRVVNLGCDRTWKLPGMLMSFLRGNPTDLLLSSFWKLNLCACIARLFSPALRLLLWEHSPPSRSRNSPRWLYGPSASLFYRMANHVVCVSGGVRDDVAKMTIGLGSRLVVIHNPIPGPPFGTVVQARGNSSRIAWVGRLDDPKNPSLMLEAFALVAVRCDANLLFIGHGSQRASLERRVQELSLGERVSFAGFRQNPYELLMQCDLLALTSDREGFGNVLIEAMHVGLDVVSTDCGAGVHEILEEPKHGKIVPLRDPPALADAIRNALASRRDPEAQRAGARRFEPDAIAGKFLAAAGF